ncbi:hypothetical protein ACFLR1_04050 [Bacteroidota bacterium]
MDLLIRWCAQVDDLGKDTYGYNILERVKCFEVTERARDVLERKLDENPPLSIKRAELFKELIMATHYEHNAPVDVIKKRLLKLGGKPTIEEVELVLKTDYEVIITSKEESKVLGGSKTKTFSLDGQVINGLGMSKTGGGKGRLKAVGSIVITNAAKERLIERLRGY